MNIQRKNSAHHFRMQSEREQTLVRSITIFFDDNYIYKDTYPITLPCSLARTGKNLKTLC